MTIEYITREVCETLRYKYNSREIEMHYFVTYNRHKFNFIEFMDFVKMMYNINTQRYEKN